MLEACRTALGDSFPIPVRSRAVRCLELVYLGDKVSHILPFAHVFQTFSCAAFRNGDCSEKD